MNLYKSTITLLFLFLFTLLSAQEAQFDDVNLSGKLDSNKAQKVDLAERVEEFAEDFIQPMMRGNAYDIEIKNIELLTEYQKNNPIRCDFQDSGADYRGKMEPTSGCHDKNSFAQIYDDAELFNAEPSNILYPFDPAIVDYDLKKDRSVIVSFQISLKSEFQESLIKFLEEETTGKDIMSYRNLPDRWGAEAKNNEHIKCMGNRPVKYCSGVLGNTGGAMKLSSEGSINEPNFVINFIDRRLEKVTFYNLRNYRPELMRSRKHRFLVNVCKAVALASHRSSYGFSPSYLNQAHVQFNDLSVVFLDKNGNAIHETVINTHQPTDTFSTSTSKFFTKSSWGGQHTYGITKSGDFILAFDYGSNVLKGRTSDYLGNRNIAGHLINDSRYTPFYRWSACGTPGFSAEDPAFSLVSNYEFHLVVQLDRNVIKEVKSAQIKYVPGSASRDKMHL